MGYGVAKLPTSQDEKARRVGGGVMLNLEGNKNCNGRRMFQGKEVCSGTPNNKVS